jgi:hypothetical protein
MNSCVLVISPPEKPNGKHAGQHQQQAANHPREISDGIIRSDQARIWDWAPLAALIAGAATRSNGFHSAPHNANHTTDVNATPISTASSTSRMRPGRRE